MAIPETDSRERVESNNQYTSVTATSGESLGQAPRINYQYSSGENKNSSSYDIGVNRESLAHHLTKETYTNATPQQSVYAKHEEQTATEAESNKTSETDSNEATTQEIFESVQEYVRRAYGEGGLRKMGLLSPEESGEEAKAEAEAKTNDHSEEEQATVAYETTETKTEKDPFTQRVGRVAGRLSVKATKVTSAFSTAPFREPAETTTESPEEVTHRTLPERIHSPRVAKTAAVLAITGTLGAGAQVNKMLSDSELEGSTSVNVEAAEYMSQMQEDAVLSAKAEQAATEAEGVVDAGSSEQVSASAETAEEAPKSKISIEWLPESVRRHGQIITEAGDTYRIDPEFIVLGMIQESGGNPEAESITGAQGLMQIMPSTQEAINRQRGVATSNMRDIRQNLDYSGWLFRNMSDRNFPNVKGEEIPVNRNHAEALAVGYHAGEAVMREFMAAGFNFDAPKLEDLERTERYAKWWGQMYAERHQAQSSAFEEWKNFTDGEMLHVAENWWAENYPAEETVNEQTSNSQQEATQNPEPVQSQNGTESVTQEKVNEGEELHAELTVAQESIEPVNEPELSPEVKKEIEEGIADSTGNIVSKFNSTATESKAETKEDDADSQNQNHTAEEVEVEDAKRDTASEPKPKPEPEPKPEAKPEPTLSYEEAHQLYHHIENKGHAWGGHANGRIPEQEMIQLPDGNELERDAAHDWNRMVADAREDGVIISLTEGYRSYEGQVAVRAQKGDEVATAEPGTSIHGHARAVDVGNGRKWIQENGWKYGWFWPFWARQEGTKNYEPWHFEYVK